jgi:hypothetical protein
VGGLVLEVAREVRAHFGPRHELGMDRAARAAIHATLAAVKVERATVRAAFDRVDAAFARPHDEIERR